MALVNDLASQQIAAPLQGATQSVTQGLDAGLAFAAAQQKAQLMDEQLKGLKEQETLKRNDYTVDALDKAGKQKNPKIRGLILEGLSKAREQWGMNPLDNDTKSFLQTDDGAKNMSAIVQMYPDFARVPEQRLEFAARLSNMLDIPFLDGLKATAEFSESYSKIKNQDLDNSFRERQMGVQAGKDQRMIDQKSFDQVADIRKETISGERGKIYDRLATAKNIQANIDEFIKNPSAYGDTGIILQGAKAIQLDSSVVREPEMNQIKAAGGVQNFIANAISKIEKGEQLQPSQRAAFQTVMGQMVSTNQRAYENSVKPIVKQANTKGIPLDQIFNSEDVPGLFGGNQQTAQPRQQQVAAAPAVQSPVVSTGINPAQQGVLSSAKKRGTTYESLPSQIKNTISKQAYEALQ